MGKTSMGLAWVTYYLLVDVVERQNLLRSPPDICEAHRSFLKTRRLVGLQEGFNCRYHTTEKKTLFAPGFAIFGCSPPLMTASTPSPTPPTLEHISGLVLGMPCCISRGVVPNFFLQVPLETPKFRYPSSFINSIEKKKPLLVVCVDVPSWFGNDHPFGHVLLQSSYIGIGEH